MQMHYSNAHCVLSAAAAAAACLSKQSLLSATAVLKLNVEQNLLAVSVCANSCLAAAATCCCCCLLENAVAAVGHCCAEAEC
jgi:hypothetical protein